MNAEQHVPQFRFKDFSDSWEQRSFKTLYKKVIEKNDLSFESDRIISVANMYYKPNDSKSDEKYMETYNIFRLGDIAFEGHKSKNFAYGRFVENTIGDGIVSHVFDVFRPISEYDLNYWKYFIHYEDIMGQKLRMSTTKATMMNNLVSKDFLKQSVLVPNLDEQQKIGTFFKQLDHLITLHQRKLAKLKELKKGYLQKLFPQNSEKVPEFRFKGYSDAWEKRKLGETNSYFTDGNYGESYPKESELSDKENGVPFLRGSNLRNGELIEDNANYITKEKHAELTSGHLVEDDIVLAVRGSLGALGYVKEENIDWNINSQLAVIRTDKSELSGKFLAQFLLSWRGQKELLSRNTGTALKQLPIKQLKDVPVPIVNLDEQKEISALFTSIDNLIAATQCKLDLLKKLKKGYLQKMFC